MTKWSANATGLWSRICASNKMKVTTNKIYMRKDRNLLTANKTAAYSKKEVQSNLSDHRHTMSGNYQIKGHNSDILSNECSHT